MQFMIVIERERERKMIPLNMQRNKGENEQEGIARVFKILNPQAIKASLTNYTLQ